MNVRVEHLGEITSVVICRPEVRNAIDRGTAEELAAAFRAFEVDPKSKVAVLSGQGGTFCAGADLKALAAGDVHRIDESGDAPLGLARLMLTKPVIAAVAGHAVAGGLEIALWCDLRVVEEDAILGVFCRRFGVPLIDGGTVRLPRLIGLSRALDLILTGRPVAADEALSIGLANRVVPRGQAFEAALRLANTISEFPQTCLRADRANCYAAFDRAVPDALVLELRGGLPALAEVPDGARRFAGGAGRHGAF